MSKCWSESGAHFFVKESDGVWVCQICGEVRPLRKLHPETGGADDDAR